MAGPVLGTGDAERVSALPAGSSCLSGGDIHVHEGFENGSPRKSVLSGRQGGGKRGQRPGHDTAVIWGPV